MCMPLPGSSYSNTPVFRSSDIYYNEKRTKNYYYFLYRIWTIFVYVARWSDGALASSTTTSKELWENFYR